MFSFITIDEKFIIALAFFACVGLIIKFFGPGIIKFLDNKSKEICKNIEKVEGEFDQLRDNIDDLKSQEQTFITKGKSLVENAENEKAFLIKTVEKKSKDLFDNAIKNQNIINKKITDETNLEFNKIAWSAATQVLKTNLIGDNKEDIHVDLIDDTLERALNLKTWKK